MKPSTSNVSLVLVGTFSPSDISIHALADCKALPDGDLTAARYEALLPDQIVDVRLPWGKLAVVGERLVVEVNEAPYVRAADLALKCIRELTPSAVVRQMGINYTAHFEMDLAQRDRIGQRLVPASNWGQFGR